MRRRQHDGDHARHGRAGQRAALRHGRLPNTLLARPGWSPLPMVVPATLLHTPPQYVPPPVYDPPAYVEPVRHYAPGPSPEDRAILGVILMVVLIVIAAACSSEATTAIERDEKQTRALVSKLDEAAREADAHIAGFLEQERRKERHHG